MEQLLLSALLSIQALIGVKTLPTDIGKWTFSKEWVHEGDAFVLEGSNSEISAACAANPNFHIIFPQVIHGVHEIYSGDKLLIKTGDSTFKRTSSFYERPDLLCGQLSKGEPLKWRVDSYSKYFSRIRYVPFIEGNAVASVGLDVGLNIATAGGMLILGLFLWILFQGRIPNVLVQNFILGCIGWSFYSFMTAAGFFKIPTSMITAHKIADLSVLIGSACYFYIFRLTGYLNKYLYYLFFLSVISGVMIILSVSSPDSIQFGTMMPFVPLVFVSINIIFKSGRNMFKNGFNSKEMLNSFSLMALGAASTNDVLHLTGVIDSYMIMPVGAVFGNFLLAVSVNRDIEATYSERDNLLQNLEQKVKEKTHDLSVAVESLKKSQAELVQQARLVSLGTLSAGIAHEINNAINFVSGAVVPLERKVLKMASPEELVSLNKLFSAIKDGTSLTVEIVRSLRNFTGLNQAKLKDVNLSEVVHDVLTILKSKLRSIQVQVNIDPNLNIFFHQVSLNQILMNLIANAADAVNPESGKIVVEATRLDNKVLINVSDNGPGISDDIRVRIFDPFFTTKEVGKGTGLGLYIVQNEIKKHQGEIEVTSSPSAGTSFRMSLPMPSQEQREAA